jgi:BASS family bile acid:Na+ symporter
LDAELIVKLVLLLGIVLLVVAIGLRARLEDPLLLWHQPVLAARAMVAMYVAVPAFVLLLVWLLPLQTGVGAVLLGFAVSPVLPPWATKGTAVGGKADYVIGLQLLSTGVSLLVAPLMIWIGYRMFGVEAPFDPMAMAMVLLITVVVPLAIGMGITRFQPGAAPRLADIAGKVGGVLLGIGVVVLLIAQGKAIIGVLGQFTLFAIVLVVGFGLLAGHLLGGPDPGNRGALASASVLRHPAIALLLASAAFPEHEATVTGAVVLYLLSSLLLNIPYERWRKSVALAEAPRSHP